MKFSFETDFYHERCAQETKSSSKTRVVLDALFDVEIQTFPKLGSATTTWPISRMSFTQFRHLSLLVCDSTTKADNTLLRLRKVYEYSYNDSICLIELTIILLLRRIETQKKV